MKKHQIIYQSFSDLHFTLELLAYLMHFLQMGRGLLPGTDFGEVSAYLGDVCLGEVGVLWASMLLSFDAMGFLDEEGGFFLG